MTTLSNALRAWGTPQFCDALRADIEQLSGAQLPLQQGLATTSYALDNNLQAMIISVTDEDAVIHAKVGIFYAGLIAGCSCADDPTPVEAQREYCEIRVTIDKTTAAATFTPLQESHE